jgi:hypothetical protein
MEKTNPNKPEQEFHIKVDKENVIVKESENPILGSELKKRGKVPETGYDLWLRVPGQAEDKFIKDDDRETVKNGDHFYSAKSVLTPGTR